MKITQKEIQANCAQNRSKLFDKMLENSIAVVVSNPEVVRNGDVHYNYRQSSDVLYLSQFPEPETILLLSNFNGRKEFMMFVRPKDKAKEIWTGKRFGVEGAVKHFGCDKALSINDFNQVFSDMLKSCSNVYYTQGINAEFDAKFMSVWKNYRVTLHDLSKILAELRLIKSPTEIKLMHKACQISSVAHIEAMKSMNSSNRASKIDSENQLQAIVESAFRFNGSTGLAYGSIVASGNNATTLHYENNDCSIGRNSLILIDAGCEVDGYASDITRTFPASGKFTQAQKEIYELVLEAQLAAIEMCKPGNTIQSVHDTAKQVMETGLNRLNILGGNQNKITDFFMHGTSHYLGLDVHDVGSYRDKTETEPKNAKSRKLEPGMVITVEPGLYFEQSDTRVDKKYRGIGIRIEDDVLITQTGHEVLSKNAPKSVQAIEALMKS